MTIDPDRLTALVWRGAFVLLLAWCLSAGVAGLLGYHAGYSEGYGDALSLVWS